MSVASVLSVDCVVVVCLPLLPRLSHCVPLAGPPNEMQPGKVGIGAAVDCEEAAAGEVAAEAAAEQAGKQQEENLPPGEKEKGG